MVVSPIRLQPLDQLADRELQPALEGPDLEHVFVRHPAAPQIGQHHQRQHAPLADPADARVVQRNPGGKPFFVRRLDLHVYENPLFLSGQQPDFDQQVHPTVPLAGLADHLAQFFVAPLRFARPIDRGVHEGKVLGQEFAQKAAQGLLPGTVVIAVLILIGSGNFIVHNRP